MDHKRHIIRLGLLVVATTAAVYCLRNERWALYQDAVSHSVKQKHYLGFFPAGEKISFRTPSFDPARADWQPGVSLGFKRPLKAGEVFAYRCQSNRALVRILSVKDGRLFYQCLTPTQKNWQSADVDSNAEITFPGGAIRWSGHSSDAVFLYADCFFADDFNPIKPVRPLREVAFPVDAESLKGFGDAEWSRITFRKYPWDP